MTEVILDDAHGPSAIVGVPAEVGRRSGWREGVRSEAKIEEGTCYQPRDGGRAGAEDRRHLQSWGLEQRTVPESLLDLGLTRPVTEALSVHGLLRPLQQASAAPFGPSPLPTQVQGLLQREMDREGWRREGGLCPEAQKRPARTPPLTAPQEGTPRLRLPEPRLLPHLVGSRRFQRERVSPGEGEGGRQGGAPGGLGAGGPCPPRRPCAASPRDAKVRSATRGPLPTGLRAPPHRVPAPRRAAGFLHAPLLTSARAGATATPPRRCPPTPGQAWHRRRKGCLWGWRWGQG